MGKIGVARESNYTIKKVLAWIFGGCLLIACALYGYYLYSVHHTITITQERLVRDQQRQINKITDYLQAYINYSKTFSINSVIQEAFKKLETLQGEELEKYKQGLTVFLEEYGNEDSFKNTLLIANDGRVLFSDFAPEYVGKKLVDSSYQDAALSQSFLRVLMSFSFDISDYAYDALLKRPALFLVRPSFADGTMVGVVVQEIPSKKMNEFMDDYIGLGKTGDVVFGSRVKDGILIISESRTQGTVPFKNFISYKTVNQDPLAPIAKGLDGLEGAGVVKGPRNNNIIAAWDFVPKVEWGVMTKVDEEEVIAKYDLIWLSALLFLIAALVLLVIGYVHFSWFSSIPSFIQRQFHIRKFKYFLMWLLTILLCIGLVVQIARCVYRSHKQLAETQENTKKQIDSMAHTIESMLASVKTLGLQLAYDLNNDLLHKDELAARMERDIKENDRIYGITIAYQPYALSKDERLFAPYVKRTKNGFELLRYDQMYDYTIEEHVVLQPVTWSWYVSVIKSGKETWFDPYIDPDTGLLLGSCSIPFFSKNDPGHTKPLGVINILVNTQPFKSLVQDSEVGKLGYTYLLSSTGQFISHPIPRYVAQQYTLFDFARKRGNKKLLGIAEDIFKGAQGFFEYRNAETLEPMWLYSVKIPMNKWVLNAVFPEKEAALPIKVVRTYALSILLLILAIIVVGSMALLRHVVFDMARLAYMLTGVFTLVLIGALAIIWLTPIFHGEQNLVITDQTRANKFAQEYSVYAQRINEPEPIIIRVGLYITELTFPDSLTTAVTGYVWQEYPKDITKDLIEPIHFVDAIEQPKFEKMYEQTQDNKIVVGWQFHVRLSQNFDYKRYPFDAASIVIGMEYPDLSKDTLLVPSLDDYRNILPQSLPGLEKNFALSGFKVHQAFFGYARQDYNANLGLQSYENVSDHYRLDYTITLTRNLLYDAVIFFLPILIIFFSLYAVFVISEGERIRGLYALSGYIGLIFAVTLLHRSLRQTLLTSDVLYIEYLFFMIYVTFAVLLIYLLLRTYGGKVAVVMQRFTRTFEMFFWPMQLAVLFIITLVVLF